MEHSQLEKLSDRMLFNFIKKINEDADIDLEDRSFTNACDHLAKIMGIGRLYYIDYNFIVATFNLNVPSFWEKSKFEGIMNRPEVKLFKYEYFEKRVETVETTYLLKQSSYDRNLVYDTIRMIESDGNLDWWDGREINRDYGDGDTIDYGFIDGSIKQIEP